MDDGALKPDIAAYFGDLVEEVAVDAPVSRVMLRVALERLQASGKAVTTDTSVHVGDGEEVFLLTVADWKRLASAASLSTAERHAAREVHRRLAISLVGDRVVGHGPFIRVNLRKKTG